MHTTLTTHRALRNKPFALSLTKQNGFYSLRQAQPRQSSQGARALFLSGGILLGIFLSLFSLQTFAIEEDVSATSLQKNITTYTVKLDGSYKEEHEFSTLIEKEDGIASHGQRYITYTPKLESIKIIEAYTLLPNGTRLKVPAKNIHTAKGAVGGSGYRDTISTVLIYPNVVVGSQLYIKYIKTRHTPIFPGHFALRRVKSPHVKAANFEINIHFDQRLKLQVASQGLEGGALPDKNGMHRYHYSYNKQDKVIPFESNEVESDDYSPYVQASTFASYAELGVAYQQKLKDKVLVTPAIQKLAQELTQGIDNPKEQTRILYNWVSKNIRYVGAYIGNGGYVPHDSQTILSNRWGDCKDHVVILEALLAAKGIASSAALINTNATYQLPRLAGVHAFNHVITYVPSLDLYLDSTAQFAPLGTLPAADLNKDVVLTALNKVGKTPPMLASENTSTTKVWMKILPDGTIQGNSTINVSGTTELNLRRTKFISQSLTQEKITEIMLGIVNLSGTGNTRSTDPNDLNKPLEASATFTLDAVANFPGPGALAIPTGLVEDALSRNSYTKPREKISFPTQCDSTTSSNHYEIEFPPNSKITHLPENVNYRDGINQYTASYLLNGNKLEVKRELIIQNSTMVCGEAENELAKQFFAVFQRDMRAQVRYD